MRVQDAIATIGACENEQELPEILQKIIEDYGFGAYCFLDIGRPDLDVPYYVGTTGRAWEEEYQHNNFIHVDEVIRQARRRNTPFTWGKVPLPPRLGKKKPGALKTMEAAKDYGFNEGLVIPFHFTDPLERVHQSLCSLIWKDRVRDFASVMSLAYQEIHLVLIYWMQRSIDLRISQGVNAPVVGVIRPEQDAFTYRLTDREREVLFWAAGGKTLEETAEILSLRSGTVETYVRNAIDKLGAGNKLHAAIKALHFGLIPYPN